MTATVTTTRPRTFGDCLRQARDEAGYDQRRAAAAIGCSRPLISLWEHDQRRPDWVQLAHMIRVYDAPWLADLLKTVTFDEGDASSTTATGRYPHGYPETLDLAA